MDGSEVRTLKNTNTGEELAVIAARGLVFSSWRFSPEELVAVRSGDPVWVVIRGEIVPEFHLQVGRRNEVVPPEIIKRARTQEAIVSSAQGKEVIAQNIRKDRLVEVVAWLYLALGASVCLMALRVLWRLAIGR